MNGRKLSKAQIEGIFQFKQKKKKKKKHSVHGLPRIKQEQFCCWLKHEP